VKPQITWGTSPAHSIPIGQRVPDPAAALDENSRRQWTQALEYMDLAADQPIEGLPIQWVFIGSCTNGRLSDLESAAQVVRGNRVAAHVNALVVPGSARVRREAEARRLDQVFIDAGFQWGEPGCGLCPGLGGVSLAPGDRCVSTSNRNFMGRQGAGVRTHLASARTAAASAISGVVTAAPET
jgi:3-isopropylmalate/(R)-2-methylmalate dehydratase large subunit